MKISNRYLLTFLHWLTSVLVSSLFLFLWVQPLDGEILLLALIFGGGASLPLFLLSLWAVPYLLKRVSSRRMRAMVLVIYSTAMCLAGFVLLVGLQLVE